MGLTLICASLLAWAPLANPAVPADVSREYEEVRAQAGRSSGDQVKMALWCEAHGLIAQRLNHLALAVLADPGNAMARGLMGLVAYNGRFQRPESVAEKAKADPTRAEYDAKRQKAPYTADGQWALGVWCDEHGLKDQARAHLTAVVRLDPSREGAWKRLGYKKHEGRWITDAQIVAEKAEVEAQKRADRHWLSTLERLKGMLAQPSKRAEAESALDAITDPRAVPSIARVFVAGRSPNQVLAVRLLGQIDAPAASRALAGLAVLSRSAEVRRAAVETLKRRDPRDFVRLWIALVRKPIRYEVTPVGGPGSPGTLTIEGQRANVRRVYAPQAMPNVSIPAGATITYDANGLPVINEAYERNVTGPRTSSQAFNAAREADQRQRDALANLPVAKSGGEAGALVRFLEKVVGAADPYLNVTTNPMSWAGEGGHVFYDANIRQETLIQIPIGEMIRETQVSAAVAQQQMASDVALLEQTNTEIHRSNEPVLQALKDVTGGNFGEDGAAWNRWWTNQEGYAITASTESPRPTFVESVPLDYTPQAGPVISQSQTTTGFTMVRQHSCFAGGTTVRTIDGARPIESIRAGDLVLSQDTRTGGLAFRPVVVAFHNPPSPTLRVDLGGEPIVATGIHRFWKAGKGWTMARDLKPGDMIRTLGGVAVVASVVDDRSQPVFNLEIANGQSFLVGTLGALVHDNSLVEATPDPFDAALETRVRPDR